MKSTVILSLLILGNLLLGCKTSPNSGLKPNGVQKTGPIEITKYEINNQGTNNCSIMGTLIDENGETMVGVSIALVGTNRGSVAGIEGEYRLDKIEPGVFKLEFSWAGMEKCTVEAELKEGDQLTLNATLSFYSNVQLEKPIIYLYPEEKTNVEVKLAYDGKLTTTYPKYPQNGWKVEAHPNGTLFDEAGKEYYSLYWEGEPRKPLGIHEGFIVSKEETTAFLEEKLEFLGLSAREANEFIVYWLPALEKNKFNLISFAGQEYLEQAQLNVSPQPDTEIRVCMVFEGLDETIDFPLQDLTPLKKTRKGFTLVEWGGQQLPKGYATEI